MATILYVIPRVHVEVGGFGVMLPGSTTPRAVWDHEPDKVRAFISRWDTRLAEAARNGIRGDFQVCAQFLAGLVSVQDTGFLARVRAAGWEVAPHEHGGAVPTEATAAMLASLTGFAPSPVVGGFTWPELPGFAAGRILTGGEPAPGHAATDMTGKVIGCWRPANATDPTRHDAAGAHIALGSGTGSLAKLVGNEARTGDGLVGDLLRGRLVGPVTVCALMLDGEDRPDGTTGLSTGDTWARILAGIFTAQKEAPGRLTTSTASNVAQAWLNAGAVASVANVASVKGV